MLLPLRYRLSYNQGANHHGFTLQSDIYLSQHSSSCNVAEVIEDHRQQFLRLSSLSGEHPRKIYLSSMAETLISSLCLAEVIYLQPQGGNFPFPLLHFQWKRYQRPPFLFIGNGDWETTSRVDPQQGFRLRRVSNIGARLYKGGERIREG